MSTLAARVSRRTLAYAAVVVWAAICVVIGAYQLASHLVTLPVPAVSDPVFHHAVAVQRRPSQRGQWLVLHVVLDECRCSQRVLEHLLARPRAPGVAERVVLVTEHRAAAAEAIAGVWSRGFDLDVVTPEKLVADYHIEAAPLLVIIDPGDTVRYLGGYTARKQAADIRDLAVISAIQRGETVAPLPTFGCAIGRALRSKLDPLGIR